MVVGSFLEKSKKKNFTNLIWLFFPGSRGERKRLHFQGTLKVWFFFLMNLHYTREDFRLYRGEKFFELVGFVLGTKRKKKTKKSQSLLCFFSHQFFFLKQKNLDIRTLTTGWARVYEEHINIRRQKNKSFWFKHQRNRPLNSKKIDSSSRSLN